ncbi:MAG: hypothetical protein WC281_01590 [Bosea sp. (in: a-proteobacteria)]|jgi:hypothetical protein
MPAAIHRVIAFRTDVSSMWCMITANSSPPIRVSTSEERIDDVRTWPPRPGRYRDGMAVPVVDRLEIVDADHDKDCTAEAGALRLTRDGPVTSAGPRR